MPPPSSLSFKGQGSLYPQPCPQALTPTEPGIPGRAGPQAFRKMPVPTGTDTAILPRVSMRSGPGRNSQMLTPGVLPGAKKVLDQIWRGEEQ